VVAKCRNVRCVASDEQFSFLGWLGPATISSVGHRLDEHFAKGTGGDKFDLAGRHSACEATRGCAAGAAIRSGVGLALQDHRRSRRWQNEFAKRACRFPVSAKSGLLRLFPSPPGHGGWQALTRSDPKGIHNFAQLPLARYTVVTPGYIAAKGIPLRAGRAVVDADAHDAQPIV